MWSVIYTREVRSINFKLCYIWWSFLIEKNNIGLSIFKDRAERPYSELIDFHWGEQILWISNEIGWYIGAIYTAIGELAHDKEDGVIALISGFKRNVFLDRIHDGFLSVKKMDK